MKTQYDYEMITREVQLDDKALDHAIEAATESNVAGDDHQTQLETAIKVYLFASMDLE